jgi:hypothetical protein
VASQEAVILFVQRTEGAVGYVEEPRTRNLPDRIQKLFCLTGPETDTEP